MAETTPPPAEAPESALTATPVNVGPKETLPVRRRTATGIERMAFEPIKNEGHGDDDPSDGGKLYVRRAFLFGSISLILMAIVWIAMENPFPNTPLAALAVELSWQGLFVFSSVVALILFLMLLLMRYFGLMIMSYLNVASYTHHETEESEIGTPMISIIVPVYNEGVLLRATIQSLLQQNYPKYEIVIVDDGSTDETGDIAREMVGEYGHVTVKLVEKPNGGKSTALNAGIQVAVSDFVLNVDGDSQLSPNTLRRCIRHFSDPKLGAVAGNVKVTNRTNMITRLQALEYVEGLNMARSAQSLIKLVNIIPGPLGLFRKQAIIDAGWYASDTFAEDCDVTLKMIREGWKVDYEPEALSYTEAPDKWLDLLKQRYRWTRGIVQAIRKHKDLFFNPTINFGGTLVMWSMAFESLIWPIMNVFANVYFVIVAVTTGASYYLIFWWLILTILDMIAAMYCVAVEKEEANLILYSVFYRIFFILFVDVCKAFALIEEGLGLGMTWGKLQRIGTGEESSAPATT